MDEGRWMDADSEDDTYSSIPWRWSLLPAVALTVATGCVEAVATGLRTLNSAAYAAVNYQADRDAFMQQAAQEMEAITNEE